MIVVFFLTDTATTEIYTLSLHDALPISRRWLDLAAVTQQTLLPSERVQLEASRQCIKKTCEPFPTRRSEEHTSELQSQSNLVCRLLLEKKKQQHQIAPALPDDHLRFTGI